MKIAEDLQKYIDENIEDIATNHIEAYKDRYIGYTVDKLETDLSINYDDSCEIENVEGEIGRELDDDEVEIFREKFYKKVICEFFGLPEDYTSMEDLKHENQSLKLENDALKEKLEEYERWTGLYDTCGKKIYFGNVVHWTDGGDELPLEERIKTRWDRIAVVGRDGIEVTFSVIDSPNAWTKAYKAVFNYGSFIYTDTEKYLTVVAQSKEEYEEKFKNAGECMEYVLKLKDENKNDDNV